MSVAEQHPLKQGLKQEATDLRARIAELEAVAEQHPLKQGLKHYF